MCKTHTLLTTTIIIVITILHYSPKLTFAFGKVVEARCALVAVEAGVVGLAGALAAAHLANLVASSVVVAVAGLAEWEPVVTAATSAGANEFGVWGDGGEGEERGMELEFQSYRQRASDTKANAL